MDLPPSLKGSGTSQHPLLARAQHRAVSLRSDRDGVSVNPAEDPTSPAPPVISLRRCSSFRQ